MENVGSTLKMIRKSLGLTQKQISADIMSQSNYSKVEKNTIDITFSSAIKVLNRFGMSVDEFVYIHNGYQKNPEKQLISFNKMFTNDKEQILKDIKILTKNNERTIRETEVLALNEALYAINENDYDKAKEKVFIIWERLKNHDNWYIYDLRLINSILYIFPVDVAKNIVSLANQRLERYKQFRDISHLSANLYTNYILLLIKNNRLEEALVELKLHISRCVNDHLYLHLGISYIRKGIVLHTVHHEKSYEWYSKGFQILEITNNTRLIADLKQEIKNFTQHDFF